MASLKLSIVRILEMIFTCISFSLVASLGHSTASFWTWCMFSWCFCFCVTFVILILDVTNLSEKLPINWEDFTIAYAMLASLLKLAVSIIYPVFYACSDCSKEIGASVTSCLTFFLYATENGLIRATCDKDDCVFLSKCPGILKVLETFVACIIFICLSDTDYTQYPGLQWCVSVYSICLIFALVFIIWSFCFEPGSVFKKVLISCNVLAVLMYMTAVFVWPFYTIHINPRPSNCTDVRVCEWNNLVVVSFMSCLNLVFYVVDAVVSFGLDCNC